jgi:hypothetical protein
MLASLFFTIYISWDSSRFLKWLSIKWAAVCWWINSESTHQTPSQLSTCPGGWIHSLLPQRTMAMDQNVKASPLHGQVIFRQFCGHFHHAYFSQPDILTHPHDKCPRSTLRFLDENVTITHRWRTAEDFVPLHWAVWWHPHTRPSVQDAQFFCGLVGKISSRIAETIRFQESQVAIDLFWVEPGLESLKTAGAGRR